ncbi:MAG: hypothetical protein HRT88_21315 [Lentisphaeraceae bacterium]|nr:hypothetical protein [Lentisphaeraceae bacterium]
MTNTVKDLVQKAFLKRDLDKLLLGEKPYRYVPKYSPAINVDIAQLIDLGFYMMDKEYLEKFSDDLEKTLLTLAQKYEGLIPVASVLLLESYSRGKEESPFVFDLKPIARELNNSIYKFEKSLIVDKSGYGQGWKDGLYGELKCKARKTIECGGPNFWVDELDE